MKPEEEPLLCFAEQRSRTLLVARARLFLLFLFGVYCVCSGLLFSSSKYGFFLEKYQIVALFLCVTTIFFYNHACYFHYEKISRLGPYREFQVVLDLFFVTTVVHLSGGVQSWFWPVYLIVTIEAAVLFDRSRCVWFLGMLGGALYGFLLLGEYAGFLSPVKMPFSATAAAEPLHLILMWLWVSLCNAAVAVISAFLMAVIRREHKAVREREKSLVDFLDSANDLIFSCSPKGEFIYVNRAWKQHLGYRKVDLGDLNVLETMDRETRSRAMAMLRRALNGDRLNPIEGRFLAQDGSRVDVEGTLSCSFRDGEPVAVWGICRDISERKQAQEQLFHQAHHDSLTGLPNRMFFVDHLKQARALARRGKNQVALLFLDLDRFKIINDTLGHSVGDKLLQTTAQRLNECIRESDTVARLGGDEFAIILGNLKHPEDAVVVARKILKTLAQPMMIERRELFVTTSIGIVVWPTDGEDPDVLLKKADLAMYSAKAQGRNNFQFYSPSMDKDAQRRLVLENSMRRAIERREFRLFYQPKVQLESGGITCLEALLRWEHPELGMVSPVEFISLAEETGLILPIGDWALREACLQNARWIKEGLTPTRVAVNLSGYQLQQKDLVEKVARTLEETGLPPEYLELEVTETVIMQNPDFAVGLLRELKDLGIQLSIDDFGTGYSSLAHLKRFAVNTLKIDKSFIQNILMDKSDAAIATAIISMGRNLNLGVVAEGVETLGQRDFLRSHNCDQVQGFFYSQPLPADQIGDILRANQLSVPWGAEKETDED